MLAIFSHSHTELFALSFDGLSLKSVFNHISAVDSFSNSPPHYSIQIKMTGIGGELRAVTFFGGEVVFN